MQVSRPLWPKERIFLSLNHRRRSYQVREQEANDALERKRQAILAQRKAATVQATMRFQRNLPGFTVMGKGLRD